MDSLLTWLRYANSAVWLAAAIITFPSMLRAQRHAAAADDLWRSVLFFVSLLILAFNLKALFAAGNQSVQAALYGCSIALAVAVVRACRR